MTRHFVLTDIDHCITDAYWRDHLIGEWDEYHAQSVHDKPAEDTVSLLKALSKDHDIIGLTARPERWYEITMRWMVQHDVPLDDVVMRGNDDYRSSPVLKTERAIGYFGSLEAMQNQVALVIDDRDDVISAFRELGLTTLQISIRRERS